MVMKMPYPAKSGRFRGKPENIFPNMVSRPNKNPRLSEAGTNFFPLCYSRQRFFHQLRDTGHGFQDPGISIFKGYRTWVFRIWVRFGLYWIFGLAFMDSDR